MRALQTASLSFSVSYATAKHLRALSRHIVVYRRLRMKQDNQTIIPMATYNKYRDGQNSQIQLWHFIRPRLTYHSTTIEFMCSKPCQMSSGMETCHFQPSSVVRGPNPDHNPPSPLYVSVARFQTSFNRQPVHDLVRLEYHIDGLFLTVSELWPFEIRPQAHAKREPPSPRLPDPSPFRIGIRYIQKSSC